MQQLGVHLCAYVNYTPFSQGVDINTLFVFRPQACLWFLIPYAIHSLCTFYLTVIVLFINLLGTLTYAPARIV